MASSKEIWQEYQEALRRGDRAAAADTLRRYQEAKRQEGGQRRSRPILVNLSSKRITYPNAVPLEKIPDEMERNPEFFELIKRMTEEK